MLLAAPSVASDPVSYYINHVNIFSTVVRYFKCSVHANHQHVTVTHVQLTKDKAFIQLLNKMAFFEKMELSSVPFDLCWDDGTPHLKI